MDVSGKTVVVTGAGRGIGQGIALGLAERGANVVVADLGVQADGSAPTARPALDTVKAITDAGGSAVAVDDTVVTMEGAENIVGTAVATWGRVDAVVCAAGVVRPRPFHEMTAADFDIVVDTHLKGHFTVSRIAFEQMMKQGDGGAIIGVSSGYLFGDADRANYRAAKAGVIGLVKSIALAGRDFRITANCIAPRADTRLTQATGITFDSPPISIAPLVAYLVSEEGRGVTGEVLGVRRGEINSWNDPSEKRSARTTDDPDAAELAGVVPWLLRGSPAVTPRLPRSTTDSGRSLADTAAIG